MLKTPTPLPPSAAAPLPRESTTPAATPTAKPDTPDLGATRTAASGNGKFRMPASGSIVRAYAKGSNDGIDIAAAGIPGEDAYVAAYCRRTGRSGIPGFNVYLAFAMFRLASIGQGVFKRNLIGIGNAPASSDNSHTKHLAATACAILDR